MRRRILRRDVALSRSRLEALLRSADLDLVDLAVALRRREAKQILTVQLVGHACERGAEVLAVPSNFTERTGRDHWEVLLRARAIENGAWVVAPGQAGGPPDQPAYGRSMIIDPWGTVVAQAPDGVGIIRADVETDRVAAVRRQIPSLANRRPSAYRLA